MPSVATWPRPPPRWPPTTLRRPSTWSLDPAPSPARSCWRSPVVWAARDRGRRTPSGWPEATPGRWRRCVPAGPACRTRAASSRRWCWRARRSALGRIGCGWTPVPVPVGRRRCWRGWPPSAAPPCWPRTGRRTGPDCSPARWRLPRPVSRRRGRLRLLPTPPSRRGRPADVPGVSALQLELLRCAVTAVRPGGVVGYVVCSPHLAETWAVVADIRRERPDVEQLDVRPLLAGVPDLRDGPAVQLWPHRHGTDAMFLALLRRRCGATVLGGA